MTRKELEQGIIMSFAEMINDDGVKLIEKKFTGDHYANFEFFINEMQYKLSIVFIKPNFIKAVCYLSISSQKITGLFNTIINNSSANAFILSRININSYLVAEHSLGIYKTTDEVDFYIDKEPINNQEDLISIAKDIFFNKVYSVILKDIVPKTDSLEKIDYLFNNLPYVNNEEDKPNWIVYSTFLPEQVLTGTLLAIQLNRIDKKEIFEKYLNYASKFENGKKESIDLMRKAIKMYS
jgi:hypothetical protein